MPRREILTSSDRVRLLAFPEDEGELIRRYTLTKADLAFVQQHRGDHNRLGIAVQMCFLRFPGRVLGENERPPDRLLNLVATQLGISTVAWDIYAQRDETRREHLLELLSHHLGMEQFGIKHGVSSGNGNLRTLGSAVSSWNRVRSHVMRNAGPLAQSSGSPIPVFPQNEL